MNIEGEPPRPKFRERENNDQRLSSRFLALCEVAHSKPKYNTAYEVISSMRVSQEPECDCHLWVGAALTVLQTHGFLTKKEREDSVNGMTTQLLEDSNEG